jgi:circadian clock protein KaiC
MTTGVEGLDRALHGGLRCASSTVIFGPTGGGKTVTCLHFLAAASAAEPGLLFGFYETPPRILLKAKLLGLDLESKLREGTLELIWYPPTERILDALAHRLLARVRERNVKRLVVDGLDGLIQAAADKGRISGFMSALTNELRIHGVTTLYTSEVNDLFASQVQLPLQGISSLVENIVLTRFVEHQRQLRRVLAIIKTRDSSYDHTVREFSISSRGAELGEALGTGHDDASQEEEQVFPVALLKRLLTPRGP